MIKIVSQKNEDELDIVAAVVWYNPTIKSIDNIKTYYNAVKKLYVIDNSDSVNSELVKKIQRFSNVDYRWLKGNLGIARALNYAIEIAEDSDYLLTMDQDSSFDGGMMEKYKSNIYNFMKIKEKNNIAIFAANNYNKEISDEKYLVMDKVMTSGNIIDVKIAKNSGGFLEKLFIDEVDHEFCYRIRKKKFKIIMFPDIKMTHSLGEDVCFSLFGKEQNINSHAPFRLYYIFRNMLYVIAKYPECRCEYLFKIFKYIIKIVFFEEKKIKRLKYAYHGVHDFANNTYGRLRKME